jgi:hypothetical protein
MFHDYIKLINSIDLVIFLPVGCIFVHFRVNAQYTVNLFPTRIVGKTQPITVQCVLLQLRM